MESYNGHYGQYPCIAYPTNSSSTGKVEYRYFYVSLTRDPGYGSMNFTHIHRSAIAFDAEPPAPIAPYEGCPANLL